MRSPAESSMSSSRRDGLSQTCLARASRSSVVSPMAETTTTTSLPAALVAGDAVRHLLHLLHVRHRRAAVLLDDDGQGSSPQGHSSHAWARAAGTVPAIVAEGTSRRQGVTQPASGRDRRRRTRPRQGGAVDSARACGVPRPPDPHHLHLRHRQRLPLGPLGLGHDGLAEGVGPHPLRHRRVRHGGRRLLHPLPVGAVRGPDPVPGPGPPLASGAAGSWACRSRSRWPRSASPSRIPAESVKWTGILALVIAFCSATQDIAISAYRIEIIPREETTKISHASAAETAGWWTGYALLGAVPFFLADRPGWTWNRIYMLLAAMWLPIMVTVVFAREGRQHRERFRGGGGEIREGAGAEGRPRPLGAVHGLARRRRSWSRSASSSGAPARSSG